MANQSTLQLHDLSDHGLAARELYDRVRPAANDLFDCIHGPWRGLALLFCFRIVLSVEKRARRYPALSSVRHMAFALRMALIAFTGTAIFASNACTYYFPMLAGLCVALHRAAAELPSSQMPPASDQPDSMPQAAKALAQFRPGTLGGSGAVAWKRPPSG